MLKENFDSLVLDLIDFYGKADLPPKQKMAKWLAKMEFIPSECQEFLYDRVSDEYSRFPENLPKAAWKFFEEWKIQHPEKFMHGVEFLCTDDACDLGMIGYFKPEGRDGLWIPFRSRCGLCRVLPQSFPGETYTRVQIKANGWIAHDFSGMLEAERLNAAIRPMHDPAKWRRGKSVKKYARDPEVEAVEKILNKSKDFARLEEKAEPDLDCPF